MSLRFIGIPGHVAKAVRETLLAPDYGHPAHKSLAQGYGPCRLCLRTFRVGVDERILFTYNPFRMGELPAPGPVFIHAGECPRYEASDLPPDLRELPLVLEGYGPAGQMLGRERASGQEVERKLGRIFAEGARYAHVRNGEVGCFIALVEDTSR